MARKYKTMTEALRKAIAEGGQTYTALENATGVKRASIMRFMRSEQSLRLDMADKLAEHFGIKVVFCSKAQHGERHGKG